LSDNNFKQYDFEHPSILFILEDKLKGLLGGSLLYNPYFKTFGLKGNESVLDFGCGGGVGSQCLANLLDKGGHLTCIDVSRYWIERARKRLDKYSNVECKSGDIRELDIPDS
jgi:SAM-dependent methyltransferase